MDWFEIDYLLQGNARQQAAYHLLKKLRIFEDLAEYTPVLVGTIPLGIDIASSDLDILLTADDLEAVAANLERFYQPQAAHYGEQNGLGYYLAKLEIADFEIEFFAQAKPTTLQNGYRHMLIEYRLLELAGEKAREAIRSLKANGLKTEPAFAQYFGLAGNPYEALLDLATWDEAALRNIVEKE